MIDLSIPQLTAYASPPSESMVEASGVAVSPPLSIEWQRAIEEVEGDPLEEGLLEGGSLSFIPDAPRETPGVYLPPSSPIPSVRPFKKLSLPKRRILALHLQGVSSRDIALSLNLSIQTVYIVLKNPTTQAIISDLLSMNQDELRALQPLVVNRMRETLRSPTDQRVGLQAVDLYMKSQHAYKEAPHKAHTAEDVIQEILKIRTEGAAEIEIGRMTVKEQS